jgi:DNA (cytosine-5)-methyltransferase 1
MLSECVDVVLAVNHWRTAIMTHEANHPETRHICARIADIDVKHDATLPDLDMILASPECTHHSNARGGRPICDQRRSTPWNVLDWVEAKLPKWVCVENVREFRDWGPLDAKGRPIKGKRGEIFRQWVKSLESYGYQVDHQVLNAADFGAATSRSRLFIVARRGRRNTSIPWPEITHPRTAWRPAYEIIDWSKPCPSIFSRKKPLADKTLARIEIGLRKFVGPTAEPFMVRLRNNCDANSVDRPLGTITTSGAHDALAVPFQLKAMGRNPGATRAITDPIPTIVAARENHSIVVPFITQYHNGPDGTTRNYDPREPLKTLDTQNRYGVVAPYLLAINHGGADDRSRSIQDPMATLTTKTGHSIVLPFLTKFYGTGGATAVTDPLDTITTKDRFGLAMVSLVKTMQELGVVDIGFRMLDVSELAAAQGFPGDYQLFGTKADRVRQIGNSVSPPVARALCQCYAEAI